MGAQEVMSIPFSSNAVDNTEYSDTDLVYAVRKALASVQNGDTDHYTQLIGMMYPKYSDFDAMAQLETLLKIPSGSVACIDVVHHQNLLSTSMVMYVDNLLKLENSSIGKVVGSVILMVVIERMRDLDLEIGWDDILQDESNRGILDMELEDAVEGLMNEGDEFPVGSLNQNTSNGNVVSELLDELMVLSFKHLKSCQNSGRLDEVFEILFMSLENYILNMYKSKFSQFLMFYACSLDPENCGVKFASKLLDIYLSINKPRVTRMSAVAYLATCLVESFCLLLLWLAC